MSPSARRSSKGGRGETGRDSRSSSAFSQTLAHRQPPIGYSLRIVGDGAHFSVMMATSGGVPSRKGMPQKLVPGWM